MQLAGNVDATQIIKIPPALDFLWLELTNQCNLRCLHCYSDSSPQSTGKDLLDESRYRALISEAYDLECRHIQFIGGEPTLNKSLPALIAHATSSGYQIVEVYSNLVSLSASLLDVFCEHNVAVATSVYANTSATHDLITQTSGSHDKTIRNIQRVLQCGLSIRVGVIAMEENKAAIDSTFKFLWDLGVTDIGLDHVRTFGRAKVQDACSMGSLCGNCAGNILAIGPDGVVAPCIMSKQWAVGSVLNSSLKHIAGSDILMQTRAKIADATLPRPSAVGEPKIADEAANMDRLRASGPYPCQPDQSCNPNCQPMMNCAPCRPYSGQPCQPNRWCNPTK